MKVFVIDIHKCNGCYNCQIACKDEHCGNDWMPYAKPQPEVGQFWCKVHNYEKGSVPKVKIIHMPVLCAHCDNAPCIESCPIDAITKREDGLVIIDPAKCNGCQICLNTCPYDVIYLNTGLSIAQKCTGCAHLLDRGWPIKEPRCSNACVVDAMQFGEEADFASQIAEADTLHPEYGLGDRVYYLGGIPFKERFIAGTVYDPATKEVVIGAECTLGGDETGTVTTDGFGDFWFNKLKANGNYTLTIKSGSKTKTIDAISTEKDVNLGDIPLT